MSKVILMGWGDIRLNMIFDDGQCRCHGVLSPVHSSSGDIARVVPVFDPKTGKTDYTPVIMQRIGIWLATKKGERPIHPEFGCCIRDYLNQPLTYSKLLALKGDVERELKELFPEPDIKVRNVSVTVPERMGVKISANIGNANIEFTANATTLSLLQEELNLALVQLGMMQPY